MKVDMMFHVDKRSWIPWVWSAARKLVLKFAAKDESHHWTPTSHDGPGDLIMSFDYGEFFYDQFIVCTVAFR